MKYSPYIAKGSNLKNGRQLNYCKIGMEVTPLEVDHVCNSLHHPLGRYIKQLAKGSYSIKT